MESSIQRILIPSDALAHRLDALAQSITEEYRGKELTVLAILNGGLFFAADLLRRIPLPLRLDCIGVSSYHGGIQSSGTVTFGSLPLPDLSGRHLLLLDDILDTGLTLHSIRKMLLEKAAPLSLKTCVLLRKLKPRLLPGSADFIGFDIGEEFVVGYGLDYQGRYRNLPYIGVLSRSHM